MGFYNRGSNLRSNLAVSRYRKVLANASDFGASKKFGDLSWRLNRYQDHKAKHTISSRLPPNCSMHRLYLSDQGILFKHGRMHVSCNHQGVYVPVETGRVTADGGSLIKSNCLPVIPYQIASLSDATRAILRVMVVVDSPASHPTEEYGLRCGSHFTSDTSSLVSFQSAVKSGAPVTIS